MAAQEPALRRRKSKMNAPLPIQNLHRDDMPMLNRSDFPSRFSWGVSTSSYQIEGAAQDGGRGESIWDRFCAEPGRIKDGSSGRVACDHFHRWPSDLDMAARLGVNAYRFSIAWPRVIPEGRGPVNCAGLDFYDRLVDGMLCRGLEPWATLYHWDLPQKLQDAGGWTHRDTVDAYLEYVAEVTRLMGDRVKHWITHNEPWCSCFLGYWEGVHAPGGTSLADALQANHHVLLSHGMAVPLIRSSSPGAKVGITLSLHPVSPASGLKADIEAARRFDGLRNRWFLDPLYGRGYPAETLQGLGRNAPKVHPGDLAHIAAPTDFLGVNYYFPEVVSDAPMTAAAPLGTKVAHKEDVERTGLGWEVSPQGLVDLLLRIKKDYAPSSIQLTENGSTYDDQLLPDGTVRDLERTRYLARHLVALRKAMDAGVPVDGYFVWSLLDNFEWAEGYTRRFGLAYVDYGSQARVLKDSGRWYTQFLAR